MTDGGTRHRAWRLSGMALACGMWCAVEAEVFWSEPGVDDGGGLAKLATAHGVLPARGWAELLRFDRLWQEPLIANGVTLELSGGISSLTLEEAIAALAATVPTPLLSIDERHILVSWPLDDGKRLQRILISRMEDGLPLTIYALELPLAALPPPVWPGDLPLPPGAEPVRVYEYPARGAIYGEFQSPLAAWSMLQSLSPRLEAERWTPMTLEAGSPEGTGDIYLNFERGELLLVGVNDAGHGVLYRRKLR